MLRALPRENRNSSVPGEAILLEPSSTRCAKTVLEWEYVVSARMEFVASGIQEMCSNS